MYMDADTQARIAIIGVERDLNERQHRKLDRIAAADPKAVVIGWHDGNSGRGPLVRTSNGSVHVINHTGYARNY